MRRTHLRVYEYSGPLPVVDREPRPLHRALPAPTSINIIARQHNNIPGLACWSRFPKTYFRLLHLAFSVLAQMTLVVRGQLRTLPAHKQVWCLQYYE